MSNPQMNEFSGRLRRIEKIKKRGGAFEASGTLGQSYYTKLRLRHQRRPILRPAVVFVCTIMLFKGVLLAAIGAEVYAQKLSVLHQGDTVEKIGAFIMAIDPFTATIAQMVAPIIGG
ncbi:hypothetical protein [Aliiruegeria sabulilitoris]|uniref:hypothetical protein n=1 Tax=Aliiruegeria sabulilitoris TaxID=1510458 RepID=UPI0012E3E497|nr:hypothetical protein [Aliiruegeria sabulilitoris]NDR55086.1 hypothetical protein [Pseudoruegeria sp. M32A2M]